MNMNDEETITVITREELVRQRRAAIRSLAGGVFLMLMVMGVRFRIPGIVLSLGAMIVGLSGLLSRERRVDRRQSIIITAAGALGMLAQFGIPLLRPFAVFILGLGAIGLFASGIWKGIVFLLELRGRH